MSACAYIMEADVNKAMMTSNISRIIICHTLNTKIPSNLVQQQEVEFTTDLNKLSSPWVKCQSVFQLHQLMVVMVIVSQDNELQIKLNAAA